MPGGSTPTCWPCRSSTRGSRLTAELAERTELGCSANSANSAVSVYSMHVTILNAGTGWHTDELCRALAERGHAGHVLPYDGLVARLGTGRGVARALAVGSHEILDADAVLA